MPTLSGVEFASASIQFAVLSTFLNLFSLLLVWRRINARGSAEFVIPSNIRSGLRPQLNDMVGPRTAQVAKASSLYSTAGGRKKQKRRQSLRLAGSLRQTGAKPHVFFFRHEVAA